MHAFISSRRRTGFTLVEVLVVTGILAILFALATGVAIRAMITAQEARVTAEMRQLETAVTSFKTKYGVSYLPSRFRLYPRISDYFNPGNSDPLTNASRDFLYQMWPRLDKTATNVNWLPGIPIGGVDLNGSECLVFFLGGPDGLVGFTKNPANPIPAAGQRGEVSFEFDSRRLKAGVFCKRTPGSPGSNSSVGSNQASPGFVYLDPYSSGEKGDQPYYYFSSYKSGNDYDFRDAILMGSSPAYPTPQPAGIDLGTFQISAYVDQNGRFFNPRGFQLISAGRDKFLANIPVTTAAPTGFSAYSNGQFITTVNYADSVDNLCNFHPVKMGIPQ